MEQPVFERFIGCGNFFSAFGALNHINVSATVLYLRNQFEYVLAQTDTTTAY
jgi:hypothetical protein